VSAALKVILQIAAPGKWGFSYGIDFYQKGVYPVDMDKHECKSIVELLSVTWDKSLDATSLTSRAKGYWEYIEDLEYDAVKSVVKKMGLAGRKWMPKPGELRINVLAEQNSEALPPEPEEAIEDKTPAEQAQPEK